jgi:hypothetical protein
MRAKKKLIGRMAMWAGGLLVLAVVAGVTALVVDYQRERRADQQWQADQRTRAEEARAYLAEIAKRIERLPVDATLASEIESRYFEERPRGPQYIWAMDEKGGFAFGVPRAAFDKLNTIYDREVTPRLKEGVFVDRLSFLLSLIDDHGAVEMQATPDARDLIGRGQRWGLDRWEAPGAVVLSAPLRAPDGVALGSVYLKRVPPPRHHERDDSARAVAATAGVIGVLSAIFLWILLPTWVYVDARERRVRRAPLFAFLTVLSSVVGLLVYLIARPEDGRTLTCPGCSREVADGAFCPHCGRDLSRSFCPACRYPLQPDWTYCPACRTDARVPPAGSPVPEAT